MYRNGRNRRGGMLKRDDNFKTILILTGIVLSIAVITFIVTYSVYNDKMNQNSGTISEPSSLASLNNNIVTKSASSSIGKTVNQVKNEMSSIDSVTHNMIEKDAIKNIVEPDVKHFDLVEEKKPEVKSVISNSEIKEEVKEEPKKDPVFSKPVEGEIIREYAKDNLVYSETLDEWITHLGLDIKADKTTVVVASADGVVESIKNDPRYGLTVVITHDNGFKSVYSNLLTAEFITEGEQVSSGQTLGTVGNNSAFEIADEPHLHFELIKDNEKVDPKIYIRF